MIDYEIAAPRPEARHIHGGPAYLAAARLSRNEWRARRAPKKPGPYVRETILKGHAPPRYGTQRLKPSRARLMRISLHEAAHAVSLVEAGAGVAAMYLRVGRDGRLRGAVTARDPSQATPRCALVGTAIDAFPADRRMFSWDVPGGDRRHLGAMGDAAINQHLQTAREFVSRRWGVIQTLADALVQKRILDGPEAERIVRGALRWPSLNGDG